MAVDYYAKHIAPRRKTVTKQEAIKAHKVESEYHADVGKQVHELLWTGTFEHDHPLIDQCLKSWQEFLDIMPEYILTHDEVAVMGSTKYGGYGGTIDAVIEFPDDLVGCSHCRTQRPRRVLMDVKTSRQLDDVYGMQVAAYTKAWPEPIDEVWVVRIGKLFTSYELRIVDVEQGFIAFEAVHGAYNNYNGGVWSE